MTDLNALRVLALRLADDRRGALGVTQSRSLDRRELEGIPTFAKSSMHSTIYLPWPPAAPQAGQPTTPRLAQR